MAVAIAYTDEPQVLTQPHGGVRALQRAVMSDYEVTIRLIEETRAFAYTVREEGRLVDSGRVETEDAIAAGYYGGSEAMD